MDKRSEFDTSGDEIIIVADSEVDEQKRGHKSTKMIQVDGLVDSSDDDDADDDEEEGGDDEDDDTTMTLILMVRRRKALKMNHLVVMMISQTRMLVNCLRQIM